MKPLSLVAPPCAENQFPHTFEFRRRLPGLGAEVLVLANPDMPVLERIDFRGTSVVGVPVEKDGTDRLSQ